MMGRGEKTFRGFSRWIDRIERALLAVLVTGMVGLSALQILLRNIWHTGLNWAEPLLGMALLFLTLLVRGKVSQELRSGTSSLLQHLSLLFVPAGVGVVVHLQRVADEWLPIVAATVISTFIGLAVTALIICAMTRQPAGEKS